MKSKKMNKNQKKTLKPINLSKLQQTVSDSEEENSDIIFESKKNLEKDKLIKKINSQAKLIIKYEDELIPLRRKKVDFEKSENKILNLQEKKKYYMKENLELKNKINLLENISLGNLERLGIKFVFKEKKIKKRKIDILFELKKKNNIIEKYEDLICDFEKFKKVVLERESFQKEDIFNLKSKIENKNNKIFEKEEEIIKLINKNNLQKNIILEREEKNLYLEKNSDNIKKKNLSLKNNFDKVFFKYDFLFDNLNEIYIRVFKFSSKCLNLKKKKYISFFKNLSNSLFQVKIIYENLSNFAIMENFCEDGLDKDFDILKKEICSLV